jgi:soluble lytic murein transglycosylase
MAAGMTTTAGVPRGTVLPTMRILGRGAVVVGSLGLWAQTLPLAAADPRQPVAALTLAGDHSAALAAVERVLASDPVPAHGAGFSYLRGRLLDRLGRLSDAAGAYADAMGNEPGLAAYARFRLADAQARLGHPEVAAGLAASLLDAPVPASLLERATRLLRESLEGGGDCRLLAGLDPRRLPDWERRQMILVKADCQLRQDTGTSPGVLVDLLAENRSDNAALDAAERVANWAGISTDSRARRLLGLTFHSHREFARSSPLLEAAIQVAETERLGHAAQFELRYALGRNHFWEGRYAVAARSFGALAAITSEPSRLAQVLLQQGRAQELANDRGAAGTFLAAHRAEPRGENAAVALFAFARLAFREGREPAAIDALGMLAAVPSWRKTAARTALFLASSDVVRARRDRAAPWLTLAATSDAAAAEVEYWRGRLAELRGSPPVAVQHYLDAVRADYFHPLSRSARLRLASATLAPATRELGLRLAAGKTVRELHGAWVLLGSGDPRGATARDALVGFLRTDPVSAPFLTLSLVPLQDWGLWRSSPTLAEERLLALGLFDEGAAAVLRHFPASNPRLALTGAHWLMRSGETRRALYVAETVAQRVPTRLPNELLPMEFRRLLYPLPWSELITGQAALRSVDPFLLAAILREESRFDPRVLSAASARGLAQFVMPTARRFAAAVGVDGLRPVDLENPAIAIALGAVYLASLDRELGGSAVASVVAYNAGEPQARLWQRYCFTGDTDELFSKVTFQETRAYLTRVLRSREQYAELYAPSDP